MAEFQETRATLASLSPKERSAVHLVILKWCMRTLGEMILAGCAGYVLGTVAFIAAIGLFLFYEGCE